MKKIYLIIALFLSLTIKSQSIYIAPSIGLYLNSDIKKPVDLIGYGVELGYCFDNEFCVGASYGTLDVVNKSPFVQVRTGYTFLYGKRFSLSAGIGLGYVFKVNQFIGEADIVANIHLHQNLDFTIAFANQGVYSIGYLPAVNIGIVKYFDVKNKKR